jgi:hypothetical protein
MRLKAEAVGNLSTNGSDDTHAATSLALLVDVARTVPACWRCPARSLARHHPSAAPSPSQ